MRDSGLVSVYTKAWFKPQPYQVNDDPVKNKIKREFNHRDKLQVVVSELTYVHVNGSWNYVCTIRLTCKRLLGLAVGHVKTCSCLWSVCIGQT